MRSSDCASALGTWEEIRASNRTMVEKSLADICFSFAEFGALTSVAEPSGLLGRPVFVSEAWRNYHSFGKKVTANLVADA